MTTMKILTKAASALAAALVAALAATASASADGPVFGASGGCALQCIQKALVTTTSTAARIELGTSVPTKVVVSARRSSTAGGLVAGPPDASASHSVLRTERVLFLVSLQPDTAYRIAVSATDAQGRTAGREGTFRTLAVSTNVAPGGGGGLSAGLGCSAECIQKAVPVQVGPTAALFEFGTDTPARMQLVVSRDADGHDVASSSSSTGLVTSWTATATSLDPGVRYHLTIRATDADGRTAVRHFRFTTVGRKVSVTLWKIKVVDDADKGSARGEIAFGYWLGGRDRGGDRDFHKRSSGDLVTVHAPGTSRPGLTVVLDADGHDPHLDLRVLGVECDGVALMKNCAQEPWPGLPSGGGDWGGDDYAVAGGPIPLSAMLTAGAVPPRLGTSMPAGHNGYFAFETTQHHLKFRVYAYVDVLYAW